MKLNEQVLEIITKLKVATALIVGQIMAQLGVWSAGQSATVQSQKHLNGWSDLGKIKRGNGYYATLDYKGSYADHDQLLTKCLAQLLALYPNSIIKREVSLPIGLRSDAIILLTKKNEGLSVVLEVCLNETQTYLNQKLSTWESWEGATETLSQLFGVTIPNYVISVEGGDYELEGRAVSFINLIDQIGGAT